MGLVIGIDVGGSTTKIVGLRDGKKLCNPMFITAADPITSLFGAFGKYIYDNGIALEDIEHVMITGVGSSSVEGYWYHIGSCRRDWHQAHWRYLDGRWHLARIVTLVAGHQ